MAIGEALAKARKRQGYSQEDLSAHLPISRESVAKYETGSRRLPDDMRKPIAEALDDVEYYFVTWKEAAGEVAIPFLNGEHVDHHPSSMAFMVKGETAEALQHLEKVSWTKPVHTRTEAEKEDMKKVLFELLDAAASIINLVAIVAREYRFSLKEIFKVWRVSLKLRKLNR
ncbi:helix-turn-helix domain-containing protein [Bacillus sp. B-jedd]|uniref:helix-turn-helix domain-containing protein n=1 Tax=Bacillus sp. B-jedd TaxID=1476857 RepID=UPI0005156F00|nr:helix-turn-helix transcriptional regulator [Bacillus sp. B-jedd]CEG25969.1 bacteriophage-like protein [Bacillus sp. B-jedd]